MIVASGFAEDFFLKGKSIGQQATSLGGSVSLPLGCSALCKRSIMIGGAGVSQGDR